MLDAARPGLDRTHLALLAQSRHRAVRETIARRDDVPVGIQAVLAQDDATEVRIAVAANPRTASSVFDHLSTDRNPSVLISLLTNPSLPCAPVERLGSHRRAKVRALALARLNDAFPVRLGDEARGEDAKFPELRERAVIVGPFSMSAVS
ncbi:hypothetical protein [Demequina sp.]|uniref:hypothetical protein n=1 Tax=Demequina sp. TaxID=2050685 RepID=UPI0025BD8C61|nr:hypothetical protein [Demequina sp.]